MLTVLFIMRAKGLIAIKYGTLAMTEKQQKPVKQRLNMPLFKIHKLNAVTLLFVSSFMNLLTSMAF